MGRIGNKFSMITKGQRDNTHSENNWRWLVLIIYLFIASCPFFIILINIKGKDNKKNAIRVIVNNCFQSDVCLFFFFSEWTHERNIYQMNMYNLVMQEVKREVIININVFDL